MSIELDKTAFLTGNASGFLEELYTRHLNDTASLDPSWREFFSDLGDDAASVIAEAQGAPWKRRDLFWDTGDGDRDGKKAAPAGDRQSTLDSLRALMLIRAYRVRGHLAATLDPLNLEPREYHPELDPKSYGFTDADMDRPIFIRRHCPNLSRAFHACGSDQGSRSRRPGAGDSRVGYSLNF